MSDTLTYEQFIRLCRKSGVRDHICRSRRNFVYVRLHGSFAYGKGARGVIVEKMKNDNRYWSITMVADGDQFCYLSTERTALRAFSIAFATHEAIFGFTRRAK